MYKKSWSQKTRRENCVWIDPEILVMAWNSSDIKVLIVIPAAVLLSPLSPYRGPFVCSVRGKSCQKIPPHFYLLSSEKVCIHINNFIFLLHYLIKECSDYFNDNNWAHLLWLATSCRCRVPLSSGQESKGTRGQSDSEFTTLTILSQIGAQDDAGHVIRAGQ